MLNLLLIAATICPPTIMENRSGKEWNDFDKQTYVRAIPMCGQKYKYSTCLKKFIKVEERVYRVVCGMPGQSK